MKVHVIQFIVLVLVLLGATSSRADHALLSDGKILYNVVVPTGSTTGGATLRLRTTQNSFGLDPHTNTVFALPQFSVTKRVEDYVTTSSVVGRKQAQAVYQQRQWNTYQPRPAAPRLVAPTPAPKFTPAPVLAQPTATPIPLNVVADTKPLKERLDQQLQIFMDEQTSLVQDGATSVVQGLVSQQQLNQQKVNLLRQQKLILQNYYPQTTDTVRLAVEYWEEQVERTGRTGRFDLENL